jgi:hypothetical protein
MAMVRRVRFCQIQLCCTVVYTGMIKEGSFRVEVLAGIGQVQLFEVEKRCFLASCLLSASMLTSHHTALQCYVLSCNMPFNKLQ